MGSPRRGARLRPRSLERRPSRSGELASSSRDVHGGARAMAAWRAAGASLRAPVQLRRSASSGGDVRPCERARRRDPKRSESTRVPSERRAGRWTQLLDSAHALHQRILPRRARGCERRGSRRRTTTSARAGLTDMLSVSASWLDDLASFGGRGGARRPWPRGTTPPQISTASARHAAEFAEDAPPAASARAAPSAGGVLSQHARRRRRTALALGRTARATRGAAAKTEPAARSSAARRLFTLPPPTWRGRALAPRAPRAEADVWVERWPGPKSAPRRWRVPAAACPLPCRRSTLRVWPAAIARARTAPRTRARRGGLLSSGAADAARARAVDPALSRRAPRRSSEQARRRIGAALGARAVRAFRAADAPRTSPAHHRAPSRSSRERYV